MQEGWARHKASQPAVLTSGASWTLSDSDDVRPTTGAHAHKYRMYKSRLRPGLQWVLQGPGPRKDRWPHLVRCMYSTEDANWWVLYQQDVGHEPGEDREPLGAEVGRAEGRQGEGGAGAAHTGPHRPHLWGTWVVETFRPG